MDLQLLLDRVRRLLLLDEDVCHEIRAGSAETLPALLVVVVASYIAGFGGVLWILVAADNADIGRFILRSFLLGGGIQAGVFLLWTSVTALVLQRLFRVRVTFIELLRVMGYGFAPMALQILLFIPALDQPIGIIALGVTFYVETYAIQTATDASPAQAFSASLFGFVCFCAILGILGNGATDLAPGIFALDPNSLSVGLTFPTGPVRR